MAATSPCVRCVVGSPEKFDDARAELWRAGVPDAEGGRMSLKRFCDRCGAEILVAQHWTYGGFEMLCRSCYDWLKKLSSASQQTPRGGR